MQKAHRQIDRLSRQYSFHRFFVVDDMLVASIVLFADPFVPAHLVAALQGTLFVSGKLRASAEAAREAVESAGVPTARLRDRPATDEPVRQWSAHADRRAGRDGRESRAGVSEATLQAWREHAVAAHAEAKRLLRDSRRRARRPPPVAQLVASGHPGARPRPRRGRREVRRARHERDRDPG